MIAFAIAMPARAQSIMLNNTYAQSRLLADAEDNSSDQNDNEYVSSLPFTTPLNETEGTSTSTLTPDLTTSSFQLSYSQTVVDSGSSATDAEAQLLFEAGANVTYTISGSSTLIGAGSAGVLVFELYDTTAGGEPYYERIVTGPGTSTLDSSGGSLTGALNPGDTYEVDAFDSETAPGSLSGNLQITFVQTVPEPSTWVLLLGGLVLLAAKFRRERQTVKI
jgi:hypothetical protein